MNLELSESETQILRTVLVAYLSDLREEIVKTDKHEWRVALHHEENILKSIVTRLNGEAS